MLAVVDAPVYIPTQWNAEEGEAFEWSVPTSHYAAVQVMVPPESSTIPPTSRRF